MGVMIDNVTLEEAADRAAAMIEEGGFHYVVTPNTEFIQRAQKDGAFQALLNGADLAVPDGVGVVHAGRILGRPLKEKVAGIELAAAVMERMAQKGQRLFLLGAKPGVAGKAAAMLASRYPGLVVCGTHDGYFKDSGPVVEEIRAARPDVIFVCLGAPKQEQWMVEYGPQTGAALLLGLGGSLDVFAGEVKRAPEVWQKMGCEWLYRLLHQPSRIGRMAKMPLFLVDAAGARLRGK